MERKHKVFISYHHDNDQQYKDELLRMNDQHRIFIDGSVDTGDIDDNDMSDEQIRQKIRDEYLKDSSVTVLLVGTQTKERKHIDWEVYSSMFDGKVNKKSGILVVLLPSAESKYWTAAHGEIEKSRIYPNCTNWINIDSRAEYERRYPYLPNRIIDNLLKTEAKISVANWSSIMIDEWRLLLAFTANDRSTCEYDLSRPMRRNNS